MLKLNLFILTLFFTGILFAQNDSLVFNLCDEFEFTGTFSAYSGTFDKLNREYLYVATKELGLHIYQTQNCSLSAIDTLPNALFSNLAVTNLFQDSIYLYVGLGNFQAAFGSDVGLAVLNIQDPNNPVILSIWTSDMYRNGVAVLKIEGDYAYMGIMDDGLLILNVSDKSNIQFTSHIQPDPNFPSVPGLFTVPHARGLDVEGDYVYVSYDAGGLRIIDVGDKTSPVEVGMYVNQYINDSAGRAYNHVIVENGFAYNAVDYCGFEVVDVRNPANPQLVSHLNLWECDFSNWQGSKGHTNEMMKLENEDIMLVASGEAELIALDISNPQNVHQIGSYGKDIDSAATWGMTHRGDEVALFYIDNSGIPPGFPQPFYSDYGGVRLLEFSSTTTGLDKEEIESYFGLEIYPNPFYQKLRISSTTGQYITKYKLLNLQGKSVMELNSYTPTLNLDFSAFKIPPGMYFLEIHSNKYVLTKSLLKIGF